jgi:hypothetical protein
MSLCDHIATANSSFSWWAAWLNANPARQVVAPSPWFANPELESADIVPAAWIRIPQSG